LAALLNRTLYGDGELGSEQAEAAWTLVDEFELRLVRGTTRVTRLRELADPRPLIRR
jgi:hypothetical protein